MHLCHLINCIITLLISQVPCFKGIVLLGCHSKNNHIFVGVYSIYAHLYYWYPAPVPFPILHCTPWVVPQVSRMIFVLQKQSIKNVVYFEQTIPSRRLPCCSSIVKKSTSSSAMMVYFVYHP